MTVNNKVTGNVSSKRKKRAYKTDRWQVMEQLPPEIRAALWDAVLPWAPVQILTTFKTLLKRHKDVRKAIDETVAFIRYNDEQEAKDGRVWGAGLSPSAMANVQPLRSYVGVSVTY